MARDEHLQALPSAAWDDLQAIVEQFESTWQSGQEARIADHLPADPARRLAVLVELIYVDLELRFKAGLPVRVENYLDRFPELAQAPHLAVNVIVAEYHHRLDRGHGPLAEEYCQRFPSYRDLVADRLENTVLEAGVTPEPASGAGGKPIERLGRYRLEGEIARGGMGKVVRVHDEEFQRPLAMKVLLRQGHPDLEERFFREARLTGQLQHPGVPPVQELGRLPDGQPYFIMKLVQGKSLGQLLKDRTAPGQELLRFLHIFEQVCQTVAYAHAHGILHRDLKPANIMVGAFGEVQVMDWGLAKLLAAGGDRPSPDAAAEEAGTVFSLPASTSADETAAGSVLGTPAYMAPEQARGEIDQLDARCDVFGLGAILCELLTGKPAFAAGSIGNNLQLARRGDLSETFARLDRCGADAELLQLARHCLAPDQNDRPAEAGAVAGAVLQYQAAVQQRLKQAEIDRAAAQARAEEEQKRREVEQAKAVVERKRRRLSLIVATLAILFLLAAGGAVVWYVQDQSARALAQAGREAEERGRRQSVNEGVQAALKETAQQQDELRRRLTHLKMVQELLSDLRQWQHLLDQRGQVLRRAQELAAGNPGLVAPAYQQRLQELRAQLQADLKDFALARQLDETRLEAANLVENRFDPTVAARRYPSIFAQAGLEVTKADAAALAARIARSPLRYAWVAALDHWAAVTEDRDLLPRLLATARQADPDPWRDQLRQVASWGDKQKLRQLVQTIQLEDQPPQTVLALVYRLRKQQGMDADLLQRALDHHPRDFWLHFWLGTAAPDPVRREGCYRVALAVRPDSSVVHNNLGVILRDKGDFPGALKHYRESLALNPNAAETHNNLGVVLKEQGNLDGAIQQCQQALARNPALVAAHINMGSALASRKNLPGALTHFRKALELAPDAAEVHGNLGVALYAARDRQGALAHLHKALELDPRYFAAHVNLGILRRDQGDLPGALQHYHRALEINPNSASAHYNLGVALRGKGDLDDAATHFRKALDLRPAYAKAHINLGVIRRAQKDLPGAIQHYRQALQINPKDPMAHFNLGQALYAQKDWPGAVQHFTRALESDANLAPAHAGLGDTLYEQKDWAGAIRHFRRALELAPNHLPTHGALGLALVEQGEFAEGQQALERALPLFPQGHPLRDHVQGQLQQCRQLLQMEQRAQEILRGQAQPTGPSEQLELAFFCRHYQKHRTAARFYAAAFAAGPKLPDEALSRHRFHAAGCAVLAARGQTAQGKEAGRLAETEKAQLRGQALGWLRADLKLHTQAVAAGRAGAQGESPKPASPLEQLTGQARAAGPAALLRACDWLERWQADPDLASVREEKALAKLPREDQSNWHKLWLEVGDLVKQARACFAVVASPKGTLTVAERQQAHVVRLTAGVDYVIDLHSQQCAARLRVENVQGERLTEKDSEPGQDLNARLIFTPPQDGDYRLVASAVPQRGTGDYTLTIRAFRKGKR